MKTKFFLCIRPPVIESDERECIKLPPPPVRSSYTAVSSKITSQGNRGLLHRKRVAPERYIRQLSVKSNGSISESKSENSVYKDSQNAPKIIKSVSEAYISRIVSDEETVSLKKRLNNSNDEVSYDRDSNSGANLMVSSLFFTIFLGKLFGILCMLILVCSLYRRRKIDDNDGVKLKKMVADSPENGLQEYNIKRVMMDGLLKRKIHYRENNKLFS